MRGLWVAFAWAIGEMPRIGGASLRCRPRFEHGGRRAMHSNRVMWRSVMRWDVAPAVRLPTAALVAPCVRRVRS